MFYYNTNAQFIENLRVSGRFRETKKREYQTPTKLES